MSEIQELEASLISLAELEKEMDAAEREAEIFRIKKTQGIYDKRRDILKKVPNFWYIVLAENDEFAEYVSNEDLKYLEDITDVHVSYDVVTDNLAGPRDFSITFEFGGNGEHISPQSVTKRFVTVLDDGEEKLESSAVSIEWPKELAEINPKNIKEETKESGMDAEAKKKYREGMKSFFAFFAWTGLKPGKEFRNGEELARLVVESVFPYAVKYYTEALPGDEEEDSDIGSSEGEPLDISDNEDEARDIKKQKTE